MSRFRGAGNNRAVSTATASSFLNTAGKVGRVTIREGIEAGRRGLSDNGTASGDRGLKTAGLPPLAVRMQSASRVVRTWGKVNLPGELLIMEVSAGRRRAGPAVAAAAAWAAG